MLLLTSCLVSTTLIPRFSHETKIGEMCPPQRVKTNLTPWAYITWKLKKKEKYGKSRSVSEFYKRELF